MGFNWKQQFSGGFYPWVVVTPDHHTTDQCSYNTESNIISPFNDSKDGIEMNVTHYE